MRMRAIIWRLSVWLLFAIATLMGCAGAPPAVTPPSSRPAPAPTPAEPRQLGTQPVPPKLAPAPSPVVFPDLAVVFLGDPTAAEVLTHDLIPFVSDRPGGLGGFDVYLYDRTVETVLLLPGANTPADEFNPSLSHGNRWLVYQSRATGNYDIVVYDLVSRLVNTLPNLNTPTFQANPTISADGALIAYSSQVGLREILNIYDLRTHINWVPAPVARLGTSIHSPFMSADGSKVAFSVAFEGENLDLYIFDLATAMVLQVPYINTPAIEDEPVLSTDNRFLVYSTNQGAGADFDIKIVDLWSGFIDNLLLLNTPGSDATPSYLGLRGDQILFVSNRAGEAGKQMYIYHLSTGQVDTVPMSHVYGFTDTFAPP